MVIPRRRTLDGHAYSNDADFISYAYDAQSVANPSTHANEVFYYTTTITVPAGGPTKVSFLAAVDEQLLDVYVNGQAKGISITSGDAFDAWHSFTLTGLQVGDNRISFKVKDTGLVEGLAVQWGTLSSGHQRDPMRFMYTGQQLDLETGLYNYGHRFYDPKSGRFINQDPAGEGPNLYAYVGNDPVTMSDPTGLSEFNPGGSFDASGWAGQVSNYHSSSNPLDYGSPTDLPSWATMSPQLSMNNRQRAEILRGAGIEVPTLGEANAASSLGVAAAYVGGSLVGTGQNVASAVKETVYKAIDFENDLLYLQSGGYVGYSNLNLSRVSQLQHSGQTTAVRATFAAVPVVGNGYNAVTGRDLMTQQPLSGLEQTAAGFGLVSDLAFTGAAAKTVWNNKLTISRVASETKPITQSIGDLRSAGLKDAHHIIQDAAVRDLPGYNTNAAPGVQLKGPSTSVGTRHYNATQVQRAVGGGTYGAERSIAYNALRAAGYSNAEALQALREADRYFNNIGVNENTPTRIPGNRR